MDIRQTLEERIAAALAAAGAADAPALVQTSTRPEHGDYQANGCMAAAKRLRTNPRRLAEEVKERLELGEMAEKVEVAGPGFLNIFLSDSWLARQVDRMARDERLGVAAAAGRVVIDYSSPNLAKEMHVGHLRSTIIGDALARVLEFCGHRVIRQNHVGDWGTQFGMLLEHLEESGGGRSLADLERFYKEAKERFDGDPEFAAAARERVVRLQAGDPECLRAWREFLDVSLDHCQRIYDRLGVGLDRECVRGESSYNEDLPRVVEDLEKAGLLRESEGAQCVFPEGFTNKENEPLGVIVRKRDGGYLYTTTDLAGIRHRCGELGADRVLYVTDSRQAGHFAQVFAIARAAGFVPPGVSLEHVPFGMMLGPDGRPFRTRSGGTVRLQDLIDEAVRRAADLVAEKNPDLGAEQREEVAHAVGVGALKYADLAQNRASDYTFTWEKMLSFDGNTAPYMQYAYARVRSIFRKAGGEGAAGGRIEPAEPAERALVLRLLQFSETLHATAEKCMPNLLCAYLFDLAGAYMRFYESCPVLKAEAAVRAGRLALCALTARVVERGLGLLGIKAVERM